MIFIAVELIGSVGAVVLASIASSADVHARSVLTRELRPTVTSARQLNRCRWTVSFVGAVVAVVVAVTDASPLDAPSVVAVELPRLARSRIVGDEAEQSERLALHLLTAETVDVDRPVGRQILVVSVHHERPKHVTGRENVVGGDRINDDPFDGAPGVVDAEEVAALDG